MLFQIVSAFLHSAQVVAISHSDNFQLKIRLLVTGIELAVWSWL